MTALKRIVTASYQTTDGQTFEKKEDAAKHQSYLNRITEIEKLITEQLQISPGSMRYLEEATVLDVALFIVNNADALREILPKRAKPTAAAEPASQTGLIGDVAPALGLNAHDVPATPAAAQTAPAFSFPAGLVANVANQQALANA